MYKHIVIVHPDMGIFVGESMGLGFFSLMETAGQTVACTFEAAEDASNFIRRWKTHNDPSDYRYVAVECEQSHYATYEELCRAGLSREAVAMAPVNAGFSGTA